MILLGMYPAAAPCDSSCFDNRVLLLPGLGTVLVALVIGAINLRVVARAFRSGPRAAPETHPQP